MIREHPGTLAGGKGWRLIIPALRMHFFNRATLPTPLSRSCRPSKPSAVCSSTFLYDERQGMTREHPRRWGIGGRPGMILEHPRKVCILFFNYAGVVFRPDRLQYAHQVPSCTMRRYGEAEAYT